MRTDRASLPTIFIRVLTSTVLLVCAVSTYGASPNDEALAFNPENYTTLNITLDGQPMTVREYRFVYVAKPIEMANPQPPRGMNPSGEVQEGTPLPDPYAYQSMRIYVPEQSLNDNTTAIIFHVRNSGWFTSEAREILEQGGAYVSDSDSDYAGAALKAGYVIASAGTRSRGAMAANGEWAGKSPAAIVDAKAAIRYLRLNDDRMPGSAERIIISGTSGGGALSVVVSASGNSPDYFPYLAEIGAAGVDENGNSSIRDDIFATVAYCPITDLGHADIAYEWQYNAVRNADNNDRGEYTEQMQQASAELAAVYPAYLASLGLTLEDGTPLTADNMDDAIIAQVKRETEEVLAEGIAIPAIGEDFVLPGRRGNTILENNWLHIEDGKVVHIDYQNYLTFVVNSRALKTVPSFDVTGHTGNEGVRGENTLFGPDDVVYFNFTEYGWNNNEVEGDDSGLDDTGLDWDAYIARPETMLDEQLKMASPMPYLNSGADSAPYWYYRHGMIDRDTSFAVEIALYHAIENDPSVKDLNFELAWLTPHSGNYDVQEAYAWIAKILAEAGTR